MTCRQIKIILIFRSVTGRYERMGKDMDSKKSIVFVKKSFRGTRLCLLGQDIF